MATNAKPGISIEDARDFARISAKPITISVPLETWEAVKRALERASDTCLCNEMPVCGKCIPCGIHAALALAEEVKV